MRSVKFSLALTESINEYLGRYECYKNGEETLSKERQQIDNLTDGGDIIKIFELYESGKFISTISGEEIKNVKMIKMQLNIEL